VDHALDTETLADLAHDLRVVTARRPSVMIDVVHADVEPRLEGEEEQTE
jgi:hypothetical protein